MLCAAVKASFVNYNYYQNSKLSVNNISIIIIKMNSLGEECNELKKQYDACFNSWFSSNFLRGHTDDSACAPFFKVYQDCVKRAMREQKIEVREIDGDYTVGGEYDDNKEHAKS